MGIITLTKQGPITSSAEPEKAGAPGRWFGFRRETHRGVTLPRGMTPDLLDRLARILNRHANGDTDELDAECAARVFEVVRAHLR